VGQYKQRQATDSIKITVLATILLGVFIAFAVFMSQVAQAGTGRLGTPQVTLNPGGGILTDGTDGLRFTINADTNYEIENYDDVREGQDGVVYRGTKQYCCNAGGPMLNIGGTLYGQA